ncbi:Uncharacterized protein SCF082_LOCUS15893 [Durusdinium trenchii]|uniref:PH domain-containing protein n=1 Tax=Durusdinium trenchii TaxID=1381693 RepID=A0ABP0K7J5_9DINO
MFHSEGDENEPGELFFKSVDKELVSSIPNPLALPASFEVDSKAALREPALRSGSVWFLQPSEHERDIQEISRVLLTVHVNGFRIRYPGSKLIKPVRSLAWSPFAVVQACRLHTRLMDERMPNVRLFKVSDFHHGISSLFAVTHPCPEEAVQQRGRWVATIACAIRMLTLSLFPVFKLVTAPSHLSWTKTRLVAGHMLLFDRTGVTPVFCELHVPLEGSTTLMAYEDDSCRCLVASLSIDAASVVTERMGVDSSCFTLNGYHFAARSVAEKVFWLRAISNIKVKLRHAMLPTTAEELKYYRLAVEEEILKLPVFSLAEPFRMGAPFLKQRVGTFWPPCDPLNTVRGAHDMPHAPQTPRTPRTPTPPQSARVAVHV